MAQTLPAGTVLEARLSSATGSGTSRPGCRVEAAVIAPVRIDDRTLVPLGSKIFGTVQEVNRLGLGLKHATAALGYRFDSLQIPGSETVPVHLRLVQVETAKERVDNRGVVRGIHPMVSLAAELSFCTVPLSFVFPLLSIPVWGIKSLIAPSANPEIFFPQGTEILLRVVAPAALPSHGEVQLRVAALVASETTSVRLSFDNLKERRAYLGTRPSDLVNLIVLGGRVQIDNAFRASGWHAAHNRSAISLYRMYLALIKRKGYPRAPMNVLTLDGVAPELAYEKSLDTIEKRHHLRLWQDPQRPGLWLAAAAEDVGFQFRANHWTHMTDPNIDSERAKVINDLAFAGCLGAAGMLNSPAAGTDGEVAVIRLQNCSAPNSSGSQAGIVQAPLHRGIYRVVRSVRDDLVRSNIAFMVYNTTLALKKDPVVQLEPGLTDTYIRNLSWIRGLGALRAEASQNNTK